MAMRTPHAPRPGRSRLERGAAVVELAIVLPLLLVLTFGMIDLARAIHFNNVLVAVSREGANLVARKADLAPQFILSTLMTTAQPLDMPSDGIMYITEVSGVREDPADPDSPILGRVDAQFRPQTGGDTSIASRFYTCSYGWSGGRCNLPSNEDARPTVDLGPGLLNLGEKVYVVEALYDFTVLSGYVIKTGPELYARTIL